MSGCMNACGHHHVGHIGILGVDKHGEEWYQISLGGSANGRTALGEVIGPAVPKDEVAPTIERIVERYLQLRTEGERFIDTIGRLGLEPFRQSAMRHIFRRREVAADEWSYLGEHGATGLAVIVPLAELRRDPVRWRAWHGRLGVRLDGSDAVEELAPELAALSLVAVEFPSPGDGRGYSQGWLLRERLAFGGELRAVGAGVRQDLLFLMARSGFDSFELAPGEDPDAARRALARYDVAYQPGAAAVALRGQRFFT